MKVKRKTAIKVYLFTSAVFLSALWRFSNEEKFSRLSFDNERISEVAIISEHVSFYMESSYSVFSESVLAEYSLPLDDGNVTSAFGYRKDPFGEIDGDSFHSGIDIAAELNSEVKAVLDGTVLSSAYDPVGGNYIIISHGNDFTSYYGHLSQRNVFPGDKVLSGQVIGLSGESGKVTGAHLHFGIYYKKNPVDPDVYFDFEKMASHAG